MRLYRAWSSSWTADEIEAADWSLTPGRYVGVAPPEEDEDFDFEQTLRDIHTELADLNKEAAELAAKIQTQLRAARRMTWLPAVSATS